MHSEKQLKFLIVDDHVMLLEGLQKLVSHKYRNSEVRTASNHKEIISEFSTTNFDVLLLDLFLKGEDSRVFLRQLLQLQPNVQIIVVSSLDDESVVCALFHEGIKGYVNKSSPTERIVEAIELVLANQTFLDPTIKHKEESYNRSGAASIILTNKEKMILNATIQGQKIKEIAEELNLSQKSIENYRNNLFTKFNVSNVVGLVREAILLGFLSDGGNDGE